MHNIENQRSQFIRPCTRVWLGLLALTSVTYGIGRMELGGTQIVMLVLIITFIKGEMVAGFFMGLRNTSLLWRAIMASWLVIVGGGIAIAYLVGLK
ncbi:MAG: cytochrome C oxidase subunit IV family protein [Gammaproteobacteria bacterium]|nr:cytochrome C oxidase subunit IV family protein [Gammaproteobacteria bacterium]MBU1977656.1 cytochrome C oxidase subunit IV family protein [Gammaproteobacteria bacterium]